MPMVTDGHVIERDGDVHEFLEGPFRGVRTRALPSLDRFHTPNSSSVRRREGTFEPADANRWLEFLPLSSAHAAAPDARSRNDH